VLGDPETLAEVRARHGRVRSDDGTTMRRQAEHRPIGHPRRQPTAVKSACRSSCGRGFFADRAIRSSTCSWAPFNPNLHGFLTYSMPPSLMLYLMLPGHAPGSLSLLAAGCKVPLGGSENQFMAGCTSCRSCVARAPTNMLFELRVCFQSASSDLTAPLPYGMSRCLDICDA
jgi:hypothetical protein